MPDLRSVVAKLIVRMAKMEKKLQKKRTFNLYTNFYRLKTRIKNLPDNQNVIFFLDIYRILLHTVKYNEMQHNALD